MTDDDFLIHLDRLSDKPQRFAGTFSPGELDLLEDSLANGQGELRYRIDASLDPQRRQVVSCIIEGFVFLTCQNSLEVFRHDLALRDRLILVENESQRHVVQRRSGWQVHVREHSSKWMGLRVPQRSLHLVQAVDALVEAQVDLPAMRAGSAKEKS